MKVDAWTKQIYEKLFRYGKKLFVGGCVFLCEWKPVCSCACMSVFMCAWLICFLCVMPVTGAITLCRRPLPAAEAVPGGWKHQLEVADVRNTLQSWNDNTAKQSLSTLRLSTSHYVSAIICADGDDMQWTSLTLKANECEFKCCLSDARSGLYNCFSLCYGAKAFPWRLDSSKKEQRSSKFLWLMFFH